MTLPEYYEDQFLQVQVALESNLLSCRCCPMRRTRSVSFQKNRQIENLYSRDLYSKGELVEVRCVIVASGPVSM